MPRLFFGIRPPPSVCAELQKKILPRLPLKSNSFRITRPENWHITVHFIGNVTAFAAKKMVERFRTEKMPEGGAIELGGNSSVGHFGNRVLYLHVRDSDGTLARAHARVKAWAPVRENGNYRPHLTLARNEGNVVLSELSTHFSTAPFTSTFLVRELILFESVQEKGETHYAPLAIRGFSKGKTPE